MPGDYVPWRYLAAKVRVDFAESTGEFFKSTFQNGPRTFEMSDEMRKVKRLTLDNLTVS